MKRVRYVGMDIHEKNDVFAKRILPVLADRGLRNGGRPSGPGYD